MSFFCNVPPLPSVSSLARLAVWVLIYTTAVTCLSVLVTVAVLATNVAVNWFIGV
jgi:hypothetical protein